MRLLQRQRKPFRLMGDDDQVYVIGHQAVTHQRELVERHILMQQAQVDQPLGVVVQNETTPIAPLGDVVRNVYGDYPR